MGGTLSKKLAWAFPVIIGILAFSAYAWMFYDMGESKATHREQAQRNAQQEAATARHSIERECSGLIGRPLRECAAEAIETARERARDHYDLEAQRDAADWAFWVLVVAAGQLIATAIGLAYIKGTLEATHKSIDQAQTDSLEQAHKMQLTVDQAKRSADAMGRVAKSMKVNAEQIVESVKISKRIADAQQMQMRAFLTVTVDDGLLQFEEQNIRFMARPRILNSGQTSAKNVRVCVQADIFPVPLPQAHHFEPAPLFSAAGFIPPQDDRHVAASLPDFLPQDRANRIAFRDGEGLYVWGRVTYDDVFGGKRETEFAASLFWIFDKDGRPSIFAEYLPGLNDAN